MTESKTTSYCTAIGKELDDLGYAYGARLRYSDETDQSYRQTIIDRIGAPQITPIQKVIKGLGYLAGYGHHPGIPFFCMFLLLMFSVGWMAGVSVFLVFGTALCFSAYNITKDYERERRHV